MFQRSQRLQQRQAFDPLYQRGRIARGTMLTVRCISFDRAGLHSSIDYPAGDVDAPSRMVVIVSKKVSRKAVERNRIKRRVRHQMRELSSVLVDGYCIAVSANRPRSRDLRERIEPLLLTCPASEIQTELRCLFDLTGLSRDRLDR